MLETMYVRLEDDPGFTSEVLYSDSTENMRDDELRKLLAQLPKQIVDGLKGVLGRPDAVSGSIPTQTSKGEDRAVSLGRILAIIVSVIVILGFIGAGFKYVLSTELAKALHQPTIDIAELRDKDIGGLKKDFEYLRKDVDALQNRLAISAFQKTTGTPSPKEVHDAATRLQEQDITVPRVAVVDTGRSLLKEMPVAVSPEQNWDAVMAVLQYVSFINAKDDPTYTKNPNPISSTELIKLPPEGLVPVAPHIVIDGFTQSLDGGIWNGFIFRNCLIRFHGGPVVLTNVRFENCKFEFTPSKRSTELAASVMEPRATANLPS